MAVSLPKSLPYLCKSVLICVKKAVPSPVSSLVSFVTFVVKVFLRNESKPHSSAARARRCDKPLRPVS